MTIKEKIDTGCNARETIILHKEGVFWVAYEQGAFYFVQAKGYKAIKKYVKAVGGDVVSAGFPASSLEKMRGDMEIQEETDQKIVVRLKVPVDPVEFVKWKERMPLRETQSKKKDLSDAAVKMNGGTFDAIIAKIREFDLSNATPLQCMVFLSELKKIL